MSAAEHHGPSIAIYVGIFLALLAGTAATVAVAYVDLGLFNNVAMIGIAITKATLVVLFFMHVWYGPRLVWVVAGAGVAWLAVLLAFTIADYVTRGPVL